VLIGVRLVSRYNIILANLELLDDIFLSCDRLLKLRKLPDALFLDSTVLLCEFLASCQVGFELFVFPLRVI
jgi:hypothetical protein